MNKPLKNVVVIFALALSIHLLQAGDKDGDVLLVKIGDISIFSDILEAPKISKLPSLKESIIEELQKSNTSPGKNLEINEELLDKTVCQIQKIILQKKLKDIVDDKVLKNHIKEIVPDSEIESLFAQQSSKNKEKDAGYLCSKALMNAYEYLDQHPNQGNAIEEAYDKFLSNTMCRKNRDKGIATWKSYVAAPGARKMFTEKHKEIESIFSGNITEEMKSKKREYYFSLDTGSTSRKNAYILNQCAKTDEKVKSYLSEKSSGKENKNYEQEIIDNWYLNELEKLSVG